MYENDPYLLPLRSAQDTLGQIQGAQIMLVSNKIPFIVSSADSPKS